MNDEATNLKENKEQLIIRFKTTRKAKKYSDVEVDYLKTIYPLYTRSEYLNEFFEEVLSRNAIAREANELCNNIIRQKSSIFIHDNRLRIPTKLKCDVFLPNHLLQKIRSLSKGMSLNDWVDNQLRLALGV